MLFIWIYKYRLYIHTYIFDYVQAQIHKNTYYEKIKKGSYVFADQRWLRNINYFLERSSGEGTDSDP
jgi:hypothetical protein